MASVNWECRHTIEQPVLISSGLSTKEPLTKWDLPSVDRFRQQIREKNNGTQPLEPWQRISQVLFEKWLKAICDADPLISVRFGWRVEHVKECAENVQSTLVNVDSGKVVTFVADYVAGRDGASSSIWNPPRWRANVRSPDSPYKSLGKLT
jgi:FAD-dependent monooxygenase